MDIYRTEKIQINVDSSLLVITFLKNNYKNLFPDSGINSDDTNGWILYRSCEGFIVNKSFEIYFSGEYSDFEEEHFIINSVHKIRNFLGIKFEFDVVPDSKNKLYIVCYCFDRLLNLYYLKLIELLSEQFKIHDLSEINNLSEDPYFTNLRPWQKQALRLWNQGFSTKEICYEFEKDKAHHFPSGRSTISNFISKARAKMGDTKVRRRQQNSN